MKLLDLNSNSIKNSEFIASIDRRKMNNDIRASNQLYLECDYYIDDDIDTEYDFTIINRLDGVSSKLKKYIIYSDIDRYLGL